MEPTTLIASLTLFALAIFLGFELITKVPPTPHALMSGVTRSPESASWSNYWSQCVVRSGQTQISGVIAFLALILATVNVVGGFA